MKINEAKLGIKLALKAGMACYLAGQPGIGKSSIVEQITQEMGLDQCKVLNAMLFDPVDLNGVPCPIEYETEDGKKIKQTVYFPTHILPQTGSGILLIDDLPGATMAMQASFYQLALDRKLGEYSLPDSWYVVASGNRLSDRGVVNPTPLPLINRFQWFEVDFALKPWIDWALDNDIRLDVISFAKFREHLFEFKPENIDNEAFLTPRSLASASRVLDQFLAYKETCTDPDEQKLLSNQSYLSELIAGNIGQGAAIEFLAFREVFSSMTPPQTILADPMGAKVPNENNPGLMYATMLAVAKNVSAVTVDNFFQYIERVPEEYAMMAYKTALKFHHDSVAQSMSNIRFINKHEDTLHYQV